ncbi:U1 small nuclear ribonucleoprotein 70 kDa [Aphelenchoides fujianensis]|nr:U1 small nuclear ribonucleoprotein 70 kDa [Aphelenchoides fujianensis]KAI6225529.1 U1 small nuclear ribonucleoprotein 70 kDa [Aphelenchoides fujianensis]
MTQFLPDNLLSLFQARPPLDFLPPPDELIVNRKRAPIQGVAQYMGLFEDPKDTPPKPHVETREEKKARRRKEKQELLAYKIEQGIATWAPAENPNATTDPYKTLFFDHRSDMSAAYKKADGMKIDGRRVVVDYERGRTQKTWLPRRLGGGKGDTRRTKKPKNARDDDRGSSNGHFRDEWRGGSGGRYGGDRGGSRNRSRSRERYGGDRRGDRDRRR